MLERRRRARFTVAFAFMTVLVRASTDPFLPSLSVHGDANDRAGRDPARNSWGTRRGLRPAQSCLPGCIVVAGDRDLIVRRVTGIDLLDRIGHITIGVDVMDHRVVIGKQLGGRKPEILGRVRWYGETQKGNHALGRNRLDFWEMNNNFRFASLRSTPFPAAGLAFR